METDTRKLSVLIVATASWVAGCFSSLQAQTSSNSEGVGPQVVLKKLVPPVYPPLARQALVKGDVHLSVSVFKDGSIKSVTPIDGPPMLVQSALDSAGRSQFDCQACSDVGATRTLTYTFQPSGEANPDPCCCSHDTRDYKPPAKQVTHSEGHITVTAPPACICPDACTAAWAEKHSNYRSVKCLYLWKCGHRTIYIQ